MSKRDLQKAREVKGVSYVDYEAWWSTTGEGSRGEEERGRAVVESSKDRRWRIRGPGRAREGGRAREVEEDWRMSSVCRGLHCCTVAWLHRAQHRWVARPRRRKEIFWGGLVQLRGRWWPSCRTKAGAGSALALGDAARPERRVEDQGLRGTRVQARVRRKKIKN